MAQLELRRKQVKKLKKLNELNVSTQGLSGALRYASAGKSIPAARIPDL